MVTLVELFIAFVLIYAYFTTISLYIFHYSLEDLERKVDELIEEFRRKR